MKWHLLLALGGPARAFAGWEPIGEHVWNDGVACYTYLSTYLVPVAAETAEPVFPTVPNFPATRGIIPPYFSNRSTLVSPSVVTEASEINENPTTIIDITTSDLAIPTDGREDPGDTATATVSDSSFQPTSATSTEASATSSEAALGQTVIFFVSPRVGDEKRGVFKRAPGGFIGSDNTNVDICTDAGTFQLAAGQLFDLQDPIYYNGEPYKEFRSQGTPPADAVTREFSDIAGTLVFASSVLPNNNAGFCQDEESGQVYITFTSIPPGCVPISLRVYAVEQCQDGRIIGLDPAESTTTEPNKSSTIAETETFAEDLSSTETTGSLDTKESSTTSSADQVRTVTSDSPFESTLPSFSLSSPPTETPFSITTSIATSIISESFTSLFSSHRTTALSESFSSVSTLSSENFSSTDTSASEPTSTLSMGSTTESATTSQVSTAITEESTTATEEPTTTTEVLTTTTEGDTTTTTEEPTTTTECNSVDPLTTVALANPTPVFGNEVYRDNDFASIIVPWDGGLAGTSQSQVYINTNGYITVDAPNTNPNNRELPTDYVVNRAFLPYWDDLVLDPTKGHTIVYEFSQGNLGTQLTIEFILGKAESPGIYHFQAVFFEESDSSVFFRYYTLPEKGSSATIGFQNLLNGRSAQVAYNQVNSVLDGEDLFLSLADLNTFVFTGFDNTECGIGQALQFP